MKCNSCNRENRAEAKFCRFCGEEIHDYSRFTELEKNPEELAAPVPSGVSAAVPAAVQSSASFVSSISITEGVVALDEERKTLNKLIT